MNMRGAFLSNEYEIIKSVRDSAVATLDGSPDCAEFGRNIRTLEGFIGSRSAISGYSVTVTHELSCYSTGAVREVKLTTHVVGDTVDSTNTFSLSR
jgi:hypothetical protein